MSMYHLRAQTGRPVTMGSRKPIRQAGIALGLAGGVLGLAGCAGSGEQPFDSQSLQGRNGAPIALVRPAASEAGATVQASVLMPVSGAWLDRAVDLYRINKKKRPGPVQTAGADLNGDGRAEVLAYFTGEDWCAETGCTLVVFTDGGRGYRAMSTTVRVKAPVLVGGSASNGWRDLIVQTGGARYNEQVVRLRFENDGYPGNAITLTPEARGSSAGEVAIAEGPGTDPAGAPAPSANLVPPANTQPGAAGAAFTQAQPPLQPGYRF